MVDVCQRRHATASKSLPSQEIGCTTLAASLFLRLGWDTAEAAASAPRQPQSLKGTGFSPYINHPKQAAASAAEGKPRPISHKSSVPHPCDFFLSQGWDTTKAAKPPSALQRNRSPAISCKLEDSNAREPPQTPGWPPPPDTPRCPPVLPPPGRTHIQSASPSSLKPCRPPAWSR